jgi:probable rRNA maturation factor
MEVLIENLQDKKTVDIPKLQEVALSILRDLKCPERCELSLVLVDDQTMQRLNREYCGIDRSTDVLSFAQQETIAPQEVQPQCADESFPLLLGDVILSIETTQKQAEEFGRSFAQELSFLLIHGILHLLGYNHETDDDAQVMEHLEQEICSHLIESQ